MFFTRHNDMDLGYAFVIPLLALFFYAWLRAAMALDWKIPNAMWGALVGMISTMVLATVPKDRARIMKDATLPGELADAIASAPYQANEWANGREDGIL